MTSKGENQGAENQGTENVKGESTMFDGHQCSDCKSTGHCSIEPIANYFKAHPEDKKHFFAALERVESGTYFVSMMVDASAVAESGSDEVGIVRLLQVAVGYMLAKGVEFPSIKPQQSRMVKAISRALARRAVNEKGTGYIPVSAEEAERVRSLAAELGLNVRVEKWPE